MAPREFLGRRAPLTSESNPPPTSPAAITHAVTELERELASAASGTTSRIECSSDNIEQSLARLVLGLIDLLRRLLERQAVRRMEGGTLTDAQVEEMGVALMKLEQKVREMADQFGLKPEDLNLDMGPLGTLWDK
jgi:hypothetical protein